MRGRIVRPGRPGRSRLRRDTGGLSSQVVSLIVALAVFLGAVAGVLLGGNSPGDNPAPADAAAEEVRADALADLLVISQGVGWASGADHVDRLGLGATNGSGLQQSRVDSLQGAG